MSDTIPDGELPRHFKGLNVMLYASGGTWWVQITPVPDNAGEALKSPWVARFHVDDWAGNVPRTHKEFLSALGVMMLCVCHEDQQMLLHT